MKIGVVGYGRWGRRVVKKLDAEKIVGVAVTNPASHSALYNFVQSIDALVDLGPTHFFVLSPIDLLTSHARIALDTGAHVFVEKPFTYDFDTLIGIHRQLEKTPSQRLHVNHLYRYSEALRQVKLEGAQAIHLHWEKYSISSFSIEENLLSHDVSILLSIFGLDVDFAVNSKVMSSGKLILKGEINNVELCLSYKLNTDPYFPQIKYLKVHRANGSSQHDLLAEPVDKLQRSLEAFLDETHQKENDAFNFHMRFADIMRTITKHPTEHQ